MHVHACYHAGMRTTIDLPDDLRAKLLALAARRGEKGFSTIVREAVTRYLADANDRAAKASRAQAALGRLSQSEASDLHAAVETLRARWR